MKPKVVQEMEKRWVDDLFKWLFEKNLTQSEAEDLLGLSKGTLSRWKSGKDNPTGPTRARILKIMKGEKL